MRKFENQVQLVKYEVLREVAALAYENTLADKQASLPYKIDPGPEPRFRCCIHHERAVTRERIALAMGGDRSNPNTVEVLDSACEQCPISRYRITESCQGCLAHRCQAACPVDAIQIKDSKATINETKCIECGRCQSACPYNAIVDIMRPCKKACPTDAITFDQQKKAVICEEKCIRCGACVYQCPFGAIQDKSEIVEVITHLREAETNASPPVYAIIAPAFASQFEFANLGQIISGIRMLGFKDVIEAALGADLVTIHEVEELAEHLTEHPFMTSSCCPAFVSFVEKKHPGMIPHVSQTVSPMIATSQLVKSIDPSAITVFIGPCVAKKSEKGQPGLQGLTDYVLTFEELVAMIDARKICLEELSESDLDNASYYGRIFAEVGGLSKAVKAAAEKMAIPITVKPIAGDGIRTCDKLLKLAKAKRLDGNFIEGMACTGGCIRGPVTMHHGKKDQKALEDYCKKALETDSLTAVRIFDRSKIILNKADIV